MSCEDNHGISLLNVQQSMPADPNGAAQADKLT